MLRIKWVLLYSKRKMPRFYSIKMHSSYTRKRICSLSLSLYMVKKIRPSRAFLIFKYITCFTLYTLYVCILSLSQFMVRKIRPFSNFKLRKKNLGPMLYTLYIYVRIGQFFWHICASKGQFYSTIRNYICTTNT